MVSYRVQIVKHETVENNMTIVMDIVFLLHPAIFMENNGNNPQNYAKYCWSHWSNDHNMMITS